MPQLNFFAAEDLDEQMIITSDSHARLQREDLARQLYILDHLLQIKARQGIRISSPGVFKTVTAKGHQKDVSKLPIWLRRGQEKRKCSKVRVESDINHLTKSVNLNSVCYRAS